jgi:hypothetical protein
LSREVIQLPNDNVPMVYPLLVKSDLLREKLKNNNIFVGQWWKYLLDSSNANEWEQILSRYMFPIQIDQRYGKEEIKFVSELVHRVIHM